MKLIDLAHVGDPSSDDKYKATIYCTAAEAAALLSGVIVSAKAEATATFPKATTLSGGTGGTSSTPLATANGAANGKPAKAAETPKAAEKPKAEAKPAEKPKATQKAEPKPEPKAEAPALDLVGADEDEPAAGDEPPDVSEDDGTFSLDGPVPEELLQAGRLLTVVSFLHGRGFHTVEAITAACNKLKDRVPLLKSNANFADRIPVAFAALPTA